MFRCYANFVIVVVRLLEHTVYVIDRSTETVFCLFHYVYLIFDI